MPDRLWCRLRKTSIVRVIRFQRKSLDLSDNILEGCARLQVLQGHAVHKYLLTPGTLGYGVVPHNACNVSLFTTKVHNTANMPRDAWQNVSNLTCRTRSSGGFHLLVIKLGLFARIRKNIQRRENLHHKLSFAGPLAAACRVW